MKAIAYGRNGPAEASTLKDAVRPAQAGPRVFDAVASAEQAGGLMDRSARFWDKVADGYSRRPVADEAAYRKKLEITRRYFRPDMEVLEIGCGTGSTAIAHAPWVKHIRAIDISSKMIEIAQSKADDEGVTNVTFERSAIDEIKVPDQSVDVVLALSILHLLENEKDVIAKVHETLKPGGVFVASTACLGDSHNWFRYIAPIGRVLGLIPRVRFFTVQALRNRMNHAGFEIDHEWQPGKGKSVFMVMKKPA